MSDPLSRRERQILDILYRRREATVAQVLADMTTPPGYDGVRTILRMLERKGFVHHREHGPRYLYSPTEPLERAQQGALKHLVATFFAGSSTQAAAALLSMTDAEIDDDELEALRALVRSQEET